MKYSQIILCGALIAVCAVPANGSKYNYLEEYYDSVIEILKGTGDYKTPEGNIVPRETAIRCSLPTIANIADEDIDEKYINKIVPYLTDLLKKDVENMISTGKYDSYPKEMIAVLGHTGSTSIIPDLEKIADEYAKYPEDRKECGNACSPDNVETAAREAIKKIKGKREFIDMLNASPVDKKIKMLTVKADIFSKAYIIEKLGKESVPALIEVVELTMQRIEEIRKKLSEYLKGKEMRRGGISGMMEDLGERSDLYFYIDIFEAIGDERCTPVIEKIRKLDLELYDENYKNVIQKIKDRTKLPDKPKRKRK